MSFDEMYDEMLHDEFRASTTSEEQPRRGLAKYRTATLVSAGGLAAATAGAFLGGLGGYFTVSPASGSPVATSSTQVPLATAADSAYTALNHAVAQAKAATGGAATTSSTNDAPASAAATFASAAGPLLSGLAPVTGTTVSTSSGTTVDGSAPSTGVPGTTGPQSTLGQVQQILTVNLNDILNNLTSALKGVISLPSDPGSTGVSAIVAPLTGVLTDVTGTLTDLSSLMPVALPTSLPVVSTVAPAAGTNAVGSSTPSSPSTPTKPSNPVSSVVAPVLNTVTNTVSSLTGGSLPAIPSLPLPTKTAAPAIPSLPVSTSSSPTLPTSLPLPTTSPVVVPVPTVTQSGGNTCVAVPTPSLPVNVNTTIKVGPVSVGVKTGGSSTGATVCAG